MALEPEESQCEVEVALLQSCHQSLIETRRVLAAERAIGEGMEQWAETQAARIAELETQADSFWGSPLPWAVMTLGVGFALGGAL